MPVREKFSTRDAAREESPSPSPRSASSPSVSTSRTSSARREGSSLPSAVRNAVFVQGDGTAPPFESGTFDSVLSHSVLEHVASAERYLAECHRVLRERGTLFLQTPPYLSFAGSHLSRLRVPIPIHLLLPRSWAFRLNFYIARKRPQWLKEPRESNTFKLKAERGEIKEDDLDPESHRGPRPSLARDGRLRAPAGRAARERFLHQEPSFLATPVPRRELLHPERASSATSSSSRGSRSPDRAVLLSRKNRNPRSRSCSSLRFRW